VKIDTKTNEYEMCELEQSDVHNAATKHTTQVRKTSIYIIYIHVCVYIYIYICVCVCVCVCTYINMYMYIYTHINI